MARGAMNQHRLVGMQTARAGEEGLRRRYRWGCVKGLDVGDVFAHGGLLADGLGWDGGVGVGQSKATQVSCHKARALKVALGQSAVLRDDGRSLRCAAALMAAWACGPASRAAMVSSTRCASTWVSKPPKAEWPDPADEIRNTDDAPPRQCGARGRPACLARIGLAVEIIAIGPNGWKSSKLLTAWCNEAQSPARGR